MTMTINYNLIIILILIKFIGIVLCYEWDTSILQAPPWKLNNCNINFTKCINDSPICSYECDFNKNNCTINVAIVLPNQTNYIVNLHKAMETLKEAENRSRKIGLLHKNINIIYRGFDDRCKQEFATLRVISSANVEFCSHVIFGPICDYCLASVGRLAKYIGNYGIPVITPVGLSFDFTNSKTNCSHEFYMVINSGPVDFRSYAEFFYLIMNRFKWKKVVLMYEKTKNEEVAGEHTCQLFMKTLMEEIKNVVHLEFIDGDLFLTKLNYSEFFKREVGVKYSIILLCTSPKYVREIAIEAYKLNMMESGEYTFFNFELYNNYTYPSMPWYDPNDLNERNEIAKNAFKSIYTFTPIHETRFNEIKNNDDAHSKRGSLYLHGLFDGMLLYANAINKSINERQTLKGYEVIKHMMGIQFKGYRDDDVMMNCNGQRVAQYALLQLNSSYQNQIVSIYNNSIKNITYWKVKWINGDPLDTPICGYDMSLCPKYDPVNILLLSLILVLCFGILIVAIILYRHFKLKAEIYSMAWKVAYEDIVFLPIKARNSFQSTISLLKLAGSQQAYYEAGDTYSVPGDRQLYTTIGYYKNIRVAVKYLKDEKIELNRLHLIELKIMKDLSNDNLVKFYGACVDIPNCILSEYCPKGSLQDILENDNVKLDWSFRMSLIMDIVRGMNYLHNSPIKSHGALKSTNCLVDSRFVLKISDFGLHFLRKHTNDNDMNIESHSYWERQLWTAPEILRLDDPPSCGTQKGDVYSFSIIMHEIIKRQGVFFLDNFRNPKEKVDAVRKGPDSNNGHPLRPLMRDELYEEEVAQIMKKCWAEDPADRPDFATLKSKLRQMNKESNGDLWDNLLARMEQYANNLETLVEERTADYLEEKRKCEELLYQLLPKTVARQLITGESVIAEIFEHVTIHFSDIVGFTALSAASTPLQVVDFLNELYTCFDSIIENFDVYKVETIGDSYMVVSGLPVRNGNAHAREIARMSLALLEAVKTFKIRHRPNEKLKLRIGIHTGSCVAGVVGLKMPRYCLFGDTVNTASRMETNGLPLKIHISSVTKQFLDEFASFDIERRGEVEVKGKGKMLTYWLNGEIKPTISTEMCSQQLDSASGISSMPLYPGTPIPSPIHKPIAGNNKGEQFQNNPKFDDDEDDGEDGPDDDTNRSKLTDDVDIPLLSISSANSDCNNAKKA